MLDQRKEPRKKLIKFTPVYKIHVVNPKTLLGYLVDLTPGGAQVNGEKELTVGETIHLSIEFPDDLPEVTKPFMAPARVARCTRDDSPQYYSIGFEFVNITPEQAKVIEAIIERYAFGREMAE